MLARPEWQRKRLEVMQAADFACEECGDREKQQSFVVRPARPLVHRQAGMSYPGSECDIPD